MFSGVEVVCFAGSYLVVFVLEFSRVFFRSGIRGAVMIGFALAGLLAHTAYIYHQTMVSGGHLIDSPKGWYLSAAWGLMAIYLYLTFYHSKTPFGLFLVPLSLILIAVGYFGASAASFPRETAGQFWRAVHGVSFLIATLSVLVGFVTSLMYLAQSKRLKRKQTGKNRLQLPSLEWLRKVNSRSLGITIITLGSGILSGIFLNRLRYLPSGEQVGGDDPFVVGSLVIFGLLTLSTVVAAAYRPVGKGRRVAYLTLLGFFLLAATLSLGLLEEEHWNRRPKEENPSSQEEGELPFLEEVKGEAAR
jgi:ABC-type uncharacterized transport system permease subunit